MRQQKTIAEELASDTGDGAAWMLKAHGYGLTGLGMVLVTAKALGLTRLSWAAVTAPLWFPWALMFLALLGLLITVFLTALFGGRSRPPASGVSQTRDRI